MTDFIATTGSGFSVSLAKKRKLPFSAQRMNQEIMRIGPDFFSISNMAPRPLGPLDRVLAKSSTEQLLYNLRG